MGIEVGISRSTSISTTSVFISSPPHGPQGAICTESDLCGSLCLDMPSFPSSPMSTTLCSCDHQPCPPSTSTYSGNDEKLWWCCCCRNCNWRCCCCCCDSSWCSVPCSTPPKSPPPHPTPYGNENSSTNFISPTSAGACNFFPFRTTVNCCGGAVHEKFPFWSIAASCVCDSDRE